MRISSLFAQMIYRAVFLVFSAAAVAMTFVNDDGFNAGTFLYYTSWSNWMIFAVMAAVFVGTAKRYARGERQGYNKTLRFFKFNATVIIFVTFAVYAFVLPEAPLIFKPEYWTSASNLLKHFFPTVDAGDDGVSKSSILHGSPPLLRYRNYTAPPCRPQGGAQEIIRARTRRYRAGSTRPFRR